MKALALAVALSLSAQAAEPKDAPVRVLKAGELVPFDGLCMTDAQAIEQAKRVAAAEAKAKALEESMAVAPPWWVVAAVGVVAVGAGVGLGYAVARR